MNSSWYLENNIDVEKSVGIDEVGRGPLAGPVVAAAVWISESTIALLEQSDILVRDSKKLSEKQRKQTLLWIKSIPDSMIRYAVGEASVEEIDSINILNAAMLAMKRAYDTLNFDADIALIDGNRSPDLGNTQTQTVIKGDDKVLSIALASIIAKEYRDAIMKIYAEQYPGYGWEKNAGYGSQQHIYAIFHKGVTPLHRKTFSPIKEAIGIAEKVVDLTDRKRINRKNKNFLA